MSDSGAEPEARVGILGPLQVACDGNDVQLSRGTPTLVLSALSAHPGPVATAALVEIVGDVRGRDVSVATIHTAIWRLRTQLGGETVLGTDDGYLLDRSRCRVDADVFGDLVEQARELLDVGQPAEAATLFEEALAMWRGTPLAALEGSTFGSVVQHRLRELRAVATEELAVALRAGGRPREAVRVLEVLVREHELREHAWSLLVGAYLDAGYVDDARAAYDRARLVLAEFGVLPGRELDAAIRPADAVAPQPVGGDPGPLPLFVGLVRRSELVGRVEELHRIDELLAPAWRGDGAVFVPLTGPAGVGKTRLAAEVAARAHAQGVTVWFEICEPNAISVLAPLGSWCRRVVAGLPDQHVRLVEDGPLGPLIRSDVLTHQSNAEREQLLRFEAIAELFTSVARPCLLVLDDAHNAPPETMRFLAHLLRTRADLPLAVVATVRPAAASADTSAAMRDVQRLPNGCDDLVVHELDEPDTATLYAALTPADRAADAADRVFEATRGNPALVSAVASAPGSLRRGPGQVDGADSSALLTTTVRAMTEELDHEAAAVLQLLAAAALVRPVVGQDLLAAASGHLAGPPVDVAAAVRAGADVGLLAADPQARTVIFRHEMVRDVTYATIPEPVRRELHLALGRAVERRATGEAADLDAVADHFERAWPLCSAEEIAPHALNAARRALSLLDLQRTLSLAQRAVARFTSEAGGHPSRLHVELLTLVAGAHAEAGDVHAAMAAYRQAADLAEHGGWTELEAIARTHALQMRSSRPQADDPDIAGLRRVLARQPDVDDNMLAEALIYLVAVDAEGSTAPVDALLAAARQRGDDHLQLKIIQELTWSTPLEDRGGYQAEYERIAQRLGEPGPLARAALHEWMADLEHGRSRFDLPWEPIGRLVREAREPLLTYDWRLWRATLLTNQGLWDDAGRLVEAARTTRFAQPLEGAWLQERPAYISAVHAVQLGSILYERGEMELLHAVGSQFPIDVLIRCSVDSRAMRARAAAEVGHPTATALCDELLDEPHLDGPKTADWLATTTYLASACGVAGHRRGAEICIGLLTPYLDRHTLVSWTQYIGAVRHNLAFAHQLLGDLDAAEEALVTAIEQYDAMAARPFATLARMHHAAVLEERGRPADRREADRLRSRVLADATTLEMTGVLRSLGEGP